MVGVIALSDDEQGVGSSIATLGYRIGMYVSSAGASTHISLYHGVGFI